MKYIDFLNNFKDFNSISLQEIKNTFGDVNFSQLTKWKKTGLLKSVKRGVFVLPKQKIDINILANELNYSYISLEYALSYYQMIPDIVRAVTSVSKNRYEKIENEFGLFNYNKIGPKLFLGYTLLDSIILDRKFRIALPEKALFDLVYLRSDLKKHNDFESLRLSLTKKFSIYKIKQYNSLVSSPQIKQRINNLINYLCLQSKKY